jgi:DNA-binding CsgD family transcriptional regulator
MRGHFGEGSRWLSSALAHPAALSEPVQMRALCGLAVLYGFQRDYDRAAPLYRHSIAIARRLGDTQALAFALTSFGWLELDYKSRKAATVYLDEGLALARGIGDDWVTALAVGNLGRISDEQGDRQRAALLFHESLTLWRQHGDSWAIALSLIKLGSLSLRTNEPGAAEGYYREALSYARPLRDRGWIAFCLEGFAGVAYSRGDLLRAARLWTAAEALRDLIGSHHSPLAIARFLPVLLYVRARLGNSRWQAIKAETRTLLLERAIAYALEPAEPAAPPPAPAGLPGGLSEREAEVLRLVAQGLTNAQIAERLVLSPYTVNAHLRTIYGKLGVNTRAAATRWAGDNGLL